MHRTEKRRRERNWKAKKKKNCIIDLFKQCNSKFGKRLSRYHRLIQTMDHVPINECDDVTGVGGIRTKKKAKYGENVFYRFGNEVLF